MFGWLKSMFASNSSILVSIPVEDTFPSSQELSMRNLITDELEAQGFGEFVGAGGGFNQMDFQYNVADVDIAKKQLAEVMEMCLPGKVYTVSIT